jgi:signal transduction histidine kinase/integral membrane sensor domain MASE1
MSTRRFRPLTDEHLVLARVAILAGVAYYVGGLVGLQMRLPHSTPSVLWPPNSILTAALLLTAPRHWGAVLFGALAAHLAVELPTEWPTLLVTLLYVTNCSEALIAAAGVRRFSDDPTAFDTSRRLAVFFLWATLIAPIISTFADAAVVSVLRGEPYAMVWRNRLMSSVLGEMTIVPALVGLVTGLRWTRRTFPVVRIVEAGLLSAGLVLCGLLASHVTFKPTALWAVSEHAPFVLQLPFLLWAAVRFGPTGASLAILTSTALMASAAVHGAGPFQGLPPGAATSATQLLLIVAAATLLYLAALIEERHRTMRELGERLAFEELLSRLSGGFVRVPSDQIATLCDKSLAHLGAFLKVDCVRLFEISSPSGDLGVVSEWTQLPDRQLRRAPVNLTFPWIVGRLVAHQTVVIPSLSSLQSEAQVDRRSLADLGYAAVMAIPLVAGGRPRGALTFGVGTERDWSSGMQARLDLVAEVFANLLARKQSEDALRTNELMKTGILDSLPSGVMVLDKHGQILDVNDTWKRIACESGLPDGEGIVPGGNLLDACASSNGTDSSRADELFAGLRQVLNGTESQFTMDFSSGSGSGVRWWQIGVVPLNRHQGAVITQTETTERRSAEIAVEQSRRALAHVARVSTVGELTASLAHQLNQPLTGIMSNAQAALRMLSRTPPDVLKIRDALSDVVDADKRAKDVIQRLHELLRKGELDMTVIDVDLAIRDISRLVADEALTRNISIRLELGPAPRLVKADRVQLQQVVLNLLLNAIEAIGDDHGSERVVAISSDFREPGTVVVSVQDSGAGIPLEAVDLVFEPFYTTKPTGMGMGLPIARSIVESHGGRISMRRAPARGMIAEFTLPAHQTAGQAF